jgi:hypothetical protein
MTKADDDALKAAQASLENILRDSPPCDAWYVKAWQPIGEHSLRRLVVFANAALALRAFFADKPDNDDPPGLMERAPVKAWRVIRNPRPGTVELTLEGLYFRLHLAPGVEAPARLTAAHVERAEWKWAPPKPRVCPKRGPRKPRPIEATA